MDNLDKDNDAVIDTHERAVWARTKTTAKKYIVSDMMTLRMHLRRLIEVSNNYRLSDQDFNAYEEWVGVIDSAQAFLDEE